MTKDSKITAKSLDFGPFFLFPTILPKTTWYHDDNIMGFQKLINPTIYGFFCIIYKTNSRVYSSTKWLSNADFVFKNSTYGKKTMHFPSCYTSPLSQKTNKPHDIMGLSNDIVVIFFIIDEVKFVDF